MSIDCALRSTDRLMWWYGGPSKVRQFSYTWSPMLQGPVAPGGWVGVDFPVMQLRSPRYFKILGCARGRTSLRNLHRDCGSTAQMSVR